MDKTPVEKGLSEETSEDVMKGAWLNWLCIVVMGTGDKLVAVAEP